MMWERKGIWFYIATVEEVEEQIAVAEEFIQMFDKYYAQKYNLKETTRSNYKYMYDHFVRDTFGKRIISKKPL